MAVSAFGMTFLSSWLVAVTAIYNHEFAINGLLQWLTRLLRHPADSQFAAANDVITASDFLHDGIAIRTQHCFFLI